MRVTIHIREPKTEMTILPLPHSLCIEIESSCDLFITRENAQALADCINNHLHPSSIETPTEDEQEQELLKIESELE